VNSRSRIAALLAQAGIQNCLRKNGEIVLQTFLP